MSRSSKRSGVRALARETEVLKNLANAEDQERERKRNNVETKRNSCSSPASTSSRSNCHKAVSTVASNAPMPPGAWLAKPSSVADTKITASVTKPIGAYREPRACTPRTGSTCAINRLLLA
jgi:hypothetical protein